MPATKRVDRSRFSMRSLFAAALGAVLVAPALALAAPASPAQASVGVAFTMPDGSPCNGEAFLLKEQPANDRGLITLDLSTGDRSPSLPLNGGFGFNALGFNNADGQLYGTYRVDTGGTGAGQPAAVNGTIWRISADGTWTQVALSGPGVVGASPGNNGLGSLPQLPAPSYPIGDFDDAGHYWVAARTVVPGVGFRTGPMYEIQITPGTAGSGPTGTVLNIVDPNLNVGLSDFTFVPGTDAFWGVSDSPAQSLVSISRSGVVTNHGVIAGIPAAQYIGMYVDANKNVSALQIGTGDVYAINRTGAVDNGEPLQATLASNVGSIGNGDAAQCGAVAPLPALRFGKVVDQAQAAHGSTLTYTLTVENIGFTDLENVPVIDTLGAGTTYIAGSAQIDGTPAGAYTGPAPGTLTWSIPTLARGATSTITFKATIDPGTQPMTITNRMDVDNPATPPGQMPPGTPEPLVDNPCADNPNQSCAVTTVPGAAALEFGKVVDRTVASSGDQLTYTVTVSNNGDAAAANVVVSDTLPDGVTFVSADNGGTNAGQSVAWTIPTLGIGQSIDLHVVAAIDADQEGETLINRVGVTNPPGSPPPIVDNPCLDDPSLSCAETTVPEAPTAALRFGKAVDQKQADPGDELTYTITVSNIGGAAAADIPVEDALPDGVTFISADNGGTNSGQSVTWTIPSLGAGESIDLHVVVSIDADQGGKTLVNGVAVTNPPGSPPPVVDHPCSADPKQSCAETTVSDRLAPPGPDPDAPDDLPDTGTNDPFWLLGAAGIALLAGTALLIGRMRGRAQARR